MTPMTLRDREMWQDSRAADGDLAPRHPKRAALGAARRRHVHRGRRQRGGRARNRLGVTEVEINLDASDGTQLIINKIQSAHTRST